MAREDGTVNSNYGWQWSREAQLDKVIDILRKIKQQDRRQ